MSKVKQLLKDGTYYTAVVNRKKIRGKVWYDGKNYWLLNNQGVGDEACEFCDYSEFSHGVEIIVDSSFGDEISHEQALRDAGVNQFTVPTDRRTKAVIDNDILPEIMNYRARKTEDGYTFGCGAVRVTKKQVKNFLSYERKRRELSESKEFYDWDEIRQKIQEETSEPTNEVDLDAVEELLKH